MSMKDNRQHVRTSYSATVKLVHSIGAMSVNLRDISVGGVFLEMEEHSRFKLGDIVHLQMQGMVQEGPIIEAEVVRITEEGLGLRFTQSDEE